MKKKIVFLALLAVIMVLCIAVGPALAYFTAYTTAQGSKTLSLVPDTKIEEPTTPDETQKEVVVSNNGNAPCFVRVRAYAGQGVSMNVTAGNGWSGGDGSDYWYYAPVLMPGEQTQTLTIALSNVPADADDFNIAVVYESTTALYDEASGEYSTDWSNILGLNVESGGTGS